MLEMPRSPRTIPVMLSAALGAFGAGCTASLEDDFEAGGPSAIVWDHCKVDEDYLRAVAPGAHGSRWTIGLRADDELDDTNNCAADRELDPLGPSLFVTDRPSAAAAERTQRNELRVQPQHWQTWGSDTWYGFSFRVNPIDEIPTAGSTRWVIGQWKQEGDGSPVVAQRFDNGVFHVSVQDADCRCYIALAPGNPDAMRLISREPLKCLYSPPDADPDEPPIDCPVPTKLRLTAGSQRLPDPKLDWIDMVYRIRGGRAPEGLVEVYANGELAARVEGPIGYDANEGDRQYFKTGMYRAWMPVEAELMFDNFTRGRSYRQVDPGRSSR